MCESSDLITYLVCCRVAISCSVYLGLCKTCKSFQWRCSNGFFPNFAQFKSIFFWSNYPHTACTSISLNFKNLLFQLSIVSLRMAFLHAAVVTCVSFSYIKHFTISFSQCIYRSHSLVFATMSKLSFHHSRISYVHQQS